MRGKIDDQGLDLLFRKARTQNSWKPQAVAEETLRRLYDLLKMGSTSANSSPARFIFAVSAEAKEKLRPALMRGNVAKTMSAPVTVIIGHDVMFYDRLPQLFPHDQTARSWFSGNPALIDETAFRNGTLQAAYLMIAARSLGLDCGPMSGFDQAKVGALFWPDGTVKCNFLCNLGYGDDGDIFPRSPRLAFDEACKII